jgi:hypothetical protein
MNQIDIDKAYVSPYDQFLFNFDATHEKTASQLQEIKKHQRIAAMRDHVCVGGDEEIVWDQF